MTDHIPDNIRQFLLQNIESIAQWEGLLLVRANPDVDWTPDTTSARLYISPADAAKLLNHLASQGFLKCSEGEEGGYRYGPKTKQLEHLINETAALYRQYLIPITNLIHNKSKSRIQEFADAFRIRKD